MTDNQPSGVQDSYGPKGPSSQDSSLTEPPHPSPQLVAPLQSENQSIPAVLSKPSFAVRPPHRAYPSNYGKYLQVPSSNSFRAAPGPKGHEQQFQHQPHFQPSRKRLSVKAPRQLSPDPESARQIANHAAFQPERARHHTRYLLDQQQGDSKMEQFTDSQLRVERIVLDPNAKLVDLSFADATKDIHVKCPSLYMAAMGGLPNHCVTIIIYDPAGKALHTQSGVVIRSDLDVTNLITLIQMYVDQWIIKVGWHESLVIEGIKIRFGAKEETDRYPALLGVPWKENINGTFPAKVVAWEVGNSELEIYWGSFRSVIQHLGNKDGAIPLFKVHTVRLCGPQISMTRIYGKELGSGHLFCKDGRTLSAKDIYTEFGDKGACLAGMSACVIQDVDHHPNLYQFFPQEYDQGKITGGSQISAFGDQGIVSVSGSEGYGSRAGSQHGNSTTSSVDFGHIPIFNATEVTPTKTAFERKKSGEVMIVDTKAQKGQRVNFGGSRPVTPVSGAAQGVTQGKPQFFPRPEPIFEPRYIVSGGRGRDDPENMTALDKGPGKYVVIEANGQTAEVWVPDRGDQTLFHPTENWAKYQNLGGDPKIHEAFPLGHHPFYPNEFIMQDQVGGGRYPVSNALAMIPKIETEEEKATRLRYTDKFVYIIDEDEAERNGEDVPTILAGLPQAPVYTAEAQKYFDDMERAKGFEEADDYEHFPDPSLREAVRNGTAMYNAGFKLPIRYNHGGGIQGGKPNFGARGGIQHPVVGAIKAESTANWGPAMNAGTLNFSRPASNSSSPTASPNVSFESTLNDDATESRKTSAGGPALNVNAPSFKTPGSIVAKPKFNENNSPATKQSISKTAPEKPVPIKTAPYGSPFSAKFGAPPTTEEFYAGLKALHPSFAQLPNDAVLAAGSTVRSGDMNAKVPGAPATTGLAGFNDLLLSSGLNLAPVANELTINSAKLPDSLYNLEVAGPGKPGMRSEGGYYSKTAAHGMVDVQSFFSRGHDGKRELSPPSTKHQAEKDAKDSGNDLSDLGKQLKDMLGPKESRFFPSAASGNKAGQGGGAQTKTPVQSLGDSILWPDTMYVNKDGERTSLYGRTQGQGGGSGFGRFQASAEDLEATRRKFPSDTVDKTMKKGGQGDGRL